MKPTVNAWPAFTATSDFHPEMDQTMPLAVQLALNLVEKGERVFLKTDAHTSEILTEASVVPYDKCERGGILFTTFRLHSPGSFTLRYDNVDDEADLAKIGDQWTLVPVKAFR